MKLSKLEHQNIGVLLGDDVEFERLSTDTRTIGKGDLFVALKGERFDAHELVQEAANKGASALVIEKDGQGKAEEIDLPKLLVENSTKALGQIAHEFRAEFNSPVVAITGSCGKTTVKGMLQSVLSEAGDCLATQGNYNNHIGVPLTLARLSDVYDFAVVEAGTSGFGEIAYLTDLIQPDVALVTNVRPAHLEGFGCVEAIAEEKSDIYGSVDSKSVAVVNLDDPNIAILVRNLSGRKVVGYTLSDSEKSLSVELDNLVCLKAFDIDAQGRVFLSADVGNGEIHIHLNLVGPHNVSNALAVIAVAKVLGVGNEDIKSGLEKFDGIPGRMQIKEGLQGSIVVDDSYNANPGSMKAAIDYLAQFDQAVLVCGDMGELGAAAESLHSDVGRYAHNKGVGDVYSVGTLSGNISKEVEFGFHFATQEALIEAIRPKLGDGVVVLIKGSRSAAMEKVVEALSLVGKQ